MKKMRYLFYDNVNDINTKELIINTFEFDSKTKVKELYMELWNTFYSEIEDGVDFVVVDGIYNNKLDFETFDNSLEEVLEYCHLDNIIMIYAIVPIGATGAAYNGYRIYIHSDEAVHRYLPHVHVDYGGCYETRINLHTLEIMDKDIFNSRKDKKVILGYLKKNQERWIGYYNSIIEGKDSDMKIEKIVS